MLLRLVFVFDSRKWNLHPFLEESIKIQVTFGEDPRLDVCPSI